MSYADGLLSTGERIIHRNKQHPFIFIWGARWTILGDRPRHAAVVDRRERWTRPGPPGRSGTSSSG